MLGKLMPIDKVLVWSLYAKIEKSWTFTIISSHSNLKASLRKHTIVAFNWELAFLASKIPHFKIRINFGQMCGQLVVVILIFAVWSAGRYRYWCLNQSISIWSRIDPTRIFTIKISWFWKISQLTYSSVISWPIAVVWKHLNTIRDLAVDFWSWTVQNSGG